MNFGPSSNQKKASDRKVLGRKNKINNDEMDVEKEGQEEQNSMIFGNQQLLGAKREREPYAANAYVPQTDEQKRIRLAESQKKHDAAYQRCLAVNQDHDFYKTAIENKLKQWRDGQKRCAVCEGCGHTPKDCPWLKKLLIAVGILEPTAVPYLYLLKSADWLEHTKLYTKIKGEI